MIKDEMRANILHAVFINKNFIVGEKKCNYEKYLLELINNSIYFREKSNFKEYIHPDSESNGECDCISPTYEMDFKLLASTTRLHASKELSDQIQIIFKGAYSHCSPRKPNTQMKTTQLHVALREYNHKSLYHLLQNKYEYGTLENDVKTYVSLLNIKKNLFFFFPYEFTFVTHYNFQYVLENINVALEKDFQESNIFREKYCFGYDTFIAYIYDDNLIISKFNNNKLKLVDCVYLFKSKTYSELYDYMLI